MALLLPQLLCALLLGCFFAASNLEAGLFLEVSHTNSVFVEAFEMDAMDANAPFYRY